MRAYAGAVATLRGARTRNLLIRALWFVAALGSLLRLARYLDNRSLWLDESFLALNLISMSTRELLGSLDYVQSAPPGFLLAEKAAILTFGEAEWTLRLVPFLASLVGLVLFVLVARRLLRPGFAVVAVTLFAVNEPLLYQSAETKPYSSDLTVALLLVWLTLRALDASETRLTFRAVLPLAIVGVGALALSYPSVFVVASAAGALLITTVCSRPREDLPLPLALSALWAGAFLLVYWTSAETIASVSGQIFSGDGRPGLFDIARSSWYTLADPGGFIGLPHALAGLLVVVGFAGLVLRDRPERFALIVGPLALALVAAFADRYPLGNRFSLFLVPFLVILVVRGLEEVAAYLDRRAWRNLLVAGSVALLVTVPVGDALVRVFDPPRGEHIRPLIQRLVREWKPGDGVYVFRNSQYAFRYYGNCDDCGVPAYPFALETPVSRLENDGTPAALVTNPPSVIIGVPDDATRRTTNVELLDTRKRVWALFSHVGVGDDNRCEDKRILGKLAERGQRLGSWHEPGAALYLYRGDG